MTLVAALSTDRAPTGRLKHIAGDPVGGVLTGLQEPQVGWLLCNGAAIPNSGKYISLYSILGTKFGVVGTLPNFMDGRVPIPKGATNFPTVGASGGEIAHVLSTAEFPSHTHLYTDNQFGVGNTADLWNIDGFDPWNRNWNGVGRTTNGAGGGGSHNNMPPFIVVGFVLVKL